MTEFLNKILISYPVCTVAALSKKVEDTTAQAGVHRPYVRGEIILCCLCVIRFSVRCSLCAAAAACIPLQFDGKKKSIEFELSGAPIFKVSFAYIIYNVQRDKESFSV